MREIYCYFDWGVGFGYATLIVLHCDLNFQKKNLYEICKLCCGWPASDKTALFENLASCISVKCHSGSNPSYVFVRLSCNNLIKCVPHITKKAAIYFRHSSYSWPISSSISLTVDNIADLKAGLFWRSIELSEQIHFQDNVKLLMS